MSDVWTVILAGAALTYLTRVGGHLVLSRVETIPPRLEAALNAIPAAVLTTIIAPTLVDGDWPERLAIVLAGLLALRLPLIATVVVSTALVAALRALGA